MNKFTLAFAASALALSACTDTGTGDECDSGEELDSAGECVPIAEDEYEGPWQVAEVSWNCDDSANTWTYSVLTDGWANTVTLDIHETGSTTPWSESHPMDNTAFAEDGSWDQWDLVLDEVTTIGEVVSGETTLFECGFHGDDSLAWMATMDAGENGTDCGVWGYQAADYWNTQQGNSCYDFSQ